ncbi:Uncharacterised protein [Candidatus Norongarragalina meridionalis]|nr:Uncharacterised protein [Candidatus Norongarragalina meridionalis]
MMKPKAKYVFLMVAAGVVILASIIGQFLLGGLDVRVMSVLMAVGCAMLAVSVVRYWRGETVEKDEMTKVVQNRMFAYSWWATYIVIAAMALGNEFRIVSLDASAILATLFFVMIITLPLAKWIVMRRGLAE